MLCNTSSKEALLENYFESEQLSVKETEELVKIFSDYVNEEN